MKHHETQGLHGFTFTVQFAMDALDAMDAMEKTEDTGGHTAVARLMMRTTPRRPTKRKTRQGSTSQDGRGWLT